jgi:hypothetical protein
MVDGDPRGRRRQYGELARPASMTNGLSSNSVLAEEAMMVSLSPSLGGDGSARWWLATVSRVTAAEQR